MPTPFILIKKFSFMCRYFLNFPIYSSWISGRNSANLPWKKKMEGEITGIPSPWPTQHVWRSGEGKSHWMSATQKQTKQSSHVTRAQGIESRELCVLWENNKSFFSLLSAPLLGLSESLWTDTPSEGHCCAWAGSQAWSQLQQRPTGFAKWSEHSPWLIQALLFMCCCALYPQQPQPRILRQSTYIFLKFIYF